MTTGPVEYLVVAFPDGNVNDGIAAELADLVSKQLIRLLDLVFVAKDASGDITAAEYDELANPGGYLEIDAEVGGLIGPDDISFIGAELDPGSAAAVLLIEDLWAARLGSAISQSGGFLLEGGRISGDLMDEAVAELSAV